MKRKSICHVISGLGSGGAETQLLRLLQSEEDGDYVHRIIALRSGGEIADSLTALGYPVYGLGMDGWPQLPAALLRLRQLIRQDSPELIQGWMYHGNTMASISRWLNFHDIPVLWNVRHSLQDFSDEKAALKLVIRFDRYLSGSARVIIYNSKAARLQHEAFGYSAHIGTVIPNGFDLDGFRFDDAVRTRIRASLNITQTAPVVGHVARYHPTKNHAGFLQAAEMILRRHPDAHFLMLGNGVVPENSALVAHASRIPADQLHLLGSRHEVAGMLSAMDVLCSTSRGEGFPNVIGEAMACCVPCVATDVGDSAFVIGDTGRVVARGDMTGLAGAVGDLLEMPQAELVTMKTAARQRIEQNFSIAGVRRQYASLYHSLIGDPE